MAIIAPEDRDAESNRKIAERVRDNKVDTVTCNNVLNVIKEKESRANVILQAAKAIKEDGTAYFSVYEGNKSGEGKQSKDDCWQNNRPTKDYVSEVEEYFEDVTLKNGVITAKRPKATDELSVWATDASYEDVVKFSRKKVDTKLAEEYDKKNGTEFVRFAKFLDNGRNLSNGEKNYFVIGKTGEMLNQYGLNGNISIKTSTVNPNRHSKKGIEAGSNDWFNVINSINSPLAITEVEDKYRLYLNTEVDGKKACVLMEALKAGRNTEISNIKTLFPREISKIIDNERENLLYPTEEKLKRIIEPSSQGHNRQASELSSVSADKVSDNSSTVQEVEEKFSRKRLDENEQTRKEYRERAIKEAQDILNDDARYAREKRDQIKNLLDDVVRRPAYSGKKLQVLSLRTQLEDAEKYLDQAEKAAMVMTDTEPRSAVREWNNGGLYTKAEMAIQKVEAELHMRDILNGLVGDTEDYTELRDDINSLLRQINTVNRSRSKNKNEALIQLNATLAEKQEQMRELLKDLTPEQLSRKRDDAPIFISNAQKAVEGIKQEKATGDQWLAMLQKAGGLKAEEDKWMGLSDFLKGKKSVTKDELLQYIAETDIWCIIAVIT